MSHLPAINAAMKTDDKLADELLKIMAPLTEMSTVVADSNDIGDQMGAAVAVGAVGFLAIALLRIEDHLRRSAAVDGPAAAALTAVADAVRYGIDGLTEDAQSVEKLLLAPKETT